jgi:hypothetical protein
MNTHIEVILLSLVILLIVVALVLAVSNPVLVLLFMSIVEAIMFALWTHSE